VDETDGEFMMEEKNINDFNLKDNLKLLSVQNDNLPEFPLTQLFKKKYDEKIKEYQTPNRKQKKKRLVLYEGETDTESVSSDITNMNLTEYSDMGDIDLQLSILKHCFQQGQYSNWMKVGCILKKTLPYEEALEYFLSHSYVAPFDNEKTKQERRIINLTIHFPSLNGRFLSSFMLPTLSVSVSPSSRTSLFFFCFLFGV
jgi:hypothetical protein